MKSVNIDTVVLDIDGVIVDVHDSYRRAIMDTVEDFTGVRPPDETIQSLKDAGGFNNDWEVTYALVLWNLIPETDRVLSYSDVIRHVTEKRQGLEGFQECLEQSIDVSVLEPALNDWEPDKIRDRFQERYLGEELFVELEGTQPQREFSGYIHEEPLLLDDKTVNELEENVQIGILTGRPSAEAQIALDRAGLDLPESRIYTMDDWDYGKPHPQALINLSEVMDSEVLLYAGDTLDDIRTVINARKQKDDVEFIACGVLTGGLRGESGRKRYQKTGADMILEDINSLTSYLH
ncbi:MAG: TIGR01548 family HAD-type hydrolase [bacterium]